LQSQAKNYNENLTADAIWQKCLIFLKQFLSMPGYEMLSSSAKPYSYEDGVFTISVSNNFTRDWIRERCESIIYQYLKDQFKNSIPILYRIDNSMEEKTDADENSVKKADEKFFSNNKKEKILKIPVKNNAQVMLNPKYNFDKFVVGGNNRFAHAAAVAVAEAPATAYNPLFIYGGVGLGKTHLIQAIASAVLQKCPHWKIVYASSEVFTNDLINSLRDHRVLEFREKYRNGVDMLLIDDIHFIAGKEKTEEEFFHTFNAIHSANKQIIVTSDRPPKELKTLGDRLRSRFEWGLMADIQPPELETRIAILRKKVINENMSVPDDILEFIATQIPSNVRELEGALTRIVAYGSLVNRVLTIPFAESVIRDMVSPRRDKPITTNLIKRKVSEYFNISIEDLSVRKRTKEIVEARQVAMYFARNLTGSSLPKIGEEFGGRDHTTVLHACDKIKALIKTNQNMRQQIEIIRKEINKAS